MHSLRKWTISVGLWSSVAAGASSPCEGILNQTLDAFGVTERNGSALKTQINYYQGAQIALQLERLRACSVSANRQTGCELTREQDNADLHENRLLKGQKIENFRRYLRSLSDSEKKISSRPNPKAYRKLYVVDALPSGKSILLTSIKNDTNNQSEIIFQPDADRISCTVTVNQAECSIWNYPQARALPIDESTCASLKEWSKQTRTDVEQAQKINQSVLCTRRYCNLFADHLRGRLPSYDVGSALHRNKRASPAAR